MGWTCTHKPAGQAMQDFFIAHGVLRWSGDGRFVYRVLDSGFVMPAFYAAVERYDKEADVRMVFAAVILVKMFRRDALGNNFCYKTMTEDDDPNEASCPERILKRLTPTLLPNSLAWRARCQSRIDAHATLAALSVGQTLALPAPLSFQGGWSEHQFIIEGQKGRGLICQSVQHGFRCHLPRKTLLTSLQSAPGPAAAALAPAAHLDHP